MFVIVFLRRIRSLLALGREGATAIRVCVVLGILGGLLCTQFAYAADTLPVEIGRSLDKQFPGWRFPVLGPQIKQCNAPSTLWVHGDFDVDGLPDYAMEVVYGDELIVFARLANGGQQVLTKRSVAIGGTQVDQALDVLPAGERIGDGPTYAHDAVVRLDCSGPATVTYFSVRAGKWRNDVQVTE